VRRKFSRGGFSFSGVWWALVFGVHSLLRHVLTPYSCFQTIVDIIGIFIYTRGHQRGARGHQVARKDHVGRPRVCSKNNISMINVFTLTNIKTKIIAGKLSKTFISEVCIKLVVLRNRHTRSSSQFQKGWWPLIYTHSPYFMCHCTEYKLSALQGTISEENKLNATAQQFIAAKISGCVLKQGTIRAIYNGKMRLR